ncbi:MAG: DMT family transporter [Hormoscilla sp. SP12CHS1]|nr:DMT family transporter [Hormoscilla sp. SP12CHS1]
MWIATLAFSLWNGLKAVVDRKEENITVKSLPDSHQEGLLFILVGIVGSASVICWAWSLTQTSVANSTVLRSMSPVFTSLGGWLLFNQRFDRRFLAGAGNFGRDRPRMGRPPNR